MGAFDDLIPQKKAGTFDDLIPKKPVGAFSDLIPPPQEKKQSDWYAGILAQKPKPTQPAETVGAINPLANLWEQEKGAVKDIGSGLAKLNPFSAERRQATVEAGKKPFLSMPSGLGQTGSALYNIGAGLFKGYPAVATATAGAESVGNIAEKSASHFAPGQKIVRSADVQTALGGFKPKSAPRSFPDALVVSEAGKHPVSGEPMPVTHGDQVTAISDEYQRLKTGKLDDNLETRQIVTKYMKEHPTLDAPDPNAKMSHAEGQAILSGHMEGDPEASAKMTPHLRKIENEYLKPLHEEAEKNHKFLKANKGLEDVQEESGTYMRRWAEGKERPWAYADDLNNPLPIRSGLKQFIKEFKTPTMRGNKQFSSTPASEHQRVYFAAEKMGSRRLLYKDKDGELRYWGSKEIFNPDFNDEKVVPAWTREIEAQTNTKYSKSALVDMLDTVMEQRAAIREIKTTKNLKASAWFQNNSIDPNNKLQPPHPEKAQRALDEGWKGTKHPQYRDLLVHPHFAEALDDAVRAKTKFEAIAIGNRVMVGTLFWSPVIHALNVWGHAFVSRGISNFTIGGQKRAFRAGLEAFHETITQGPKYREFLRNGGALLSGSLDNHEMHTQMLNKMAESIKKDKMFGLMTGLKNPAQLIPMLYKASNKALWTVGDMLMMQRYLEEVAKGKTIRGAISEVEKHIPNYRIPPKVMGSRLISALYQSPELGQFNRYHYGVFKAYNAILTDTVGRGAKGTIEEQANALGQLATTAFLAAVIWPGLNEAIQWISNKKNAHMIAFGPLSPLDAMGLLPGSQKRGNLSALARAAYMYSPMVDLILEGTWNRDLFTGQNITTRSLDQSFIRSAGRQAGQAVEKLLQVGVAPYQISAQEWRDSVSGKSIPRAIGEALLAQGAGIKLPDKPDFDPVKGHWRKTGENNETHYRMRRKGARGPIEYFTGDPVKHTKGIWSNIIGIVKHDKKKPGMGGPQ